MCARRLTYSSCPPASARNVSYFVCLDSAQGPKPPVFFYFGNEDHIELYIDHTGIMWETAPAMGAALVFLEHRYYGQSLPFPPGTPGSLLQVRNKASRTTPTLLFSHDCPSPARAATYPAHLCCRPALQAACHT